MGMQKGKDREWANFYLARFSGFSACGLVIYVHLSNLKDLGCFIVSIIIPDVGNGLLLVDLDQPCNGLGTRLRRGAHCT